MTNKSNVHCAHITSPFKGGPMKVCSKDAYRSRHYLTGIVLTQYLVLSSRKLHSVDGDFSVQEAHGLLHHPGVHTLRISGHAQLDCLLDEAG